jgi:hypothetical protein
MTITELSKRFAEQNKIDLHTWRTIGTDKKVYDHSNPDLTLAQNVLDICVEWPDWEEFSIAHGSFSHWHEIAGNKYVCWLNLDYIQDRTGKLLRLVVEWRDEHK